MKNINERLRPEKPYTLVGVDGNAFSIMGFVARIMRENGHSKDEIDQYRQDAMSSDYNNLLCISMDMVDMINNELGFDDFDEDIDESVEFDDKIEFNDDILNTTHLLPVVGDERCLYITAEDFKELPLNLDDIHQIFKDNFINVEAAICNGTDFQAVYKRPSEGDKLIRLIAKAGECVYSDIKKYVYTAEQFKDIYMSSFKNLKFGKHSVNENEYWDEPIADEQTDNSEAIREIKTAIENAMIVLWDEYGIEFSKSTAKEWALQAAEEFDPNTLSIADVMED